MAAIKLMVQMCMVLSGVAITFVVLSEIRFTRECNRFCNSDKENPECYLRRSAVLVYDQDVSSHEMSFSQNAHPRINLANYAMEVTSGRYFDMSCPVDHYWPRVSTLSRHKSCAVVGNSGILTGSNCGKVIDAHDYVIRANLAPIRGYTADVGESANLTILNFETLFYLQRNLTKTSPDSDWHRDYVERVMYLNDSIIWYAKSTLQRNSSLYLRNVAHVLKDYYELPIQLAYSWRPVSIEKFHGLRHYATTGFNAFIIAKTFCDHVTLYGFYPSQTDDNGYHVNHHYYEDVEYEYTNNVHNFNQEFNKLKEAADKGEVTIVTDVCPGGERKRVAAHVKRGSLVDTKFMFRLEDKKLKEMFDVSQNRAKVEPKQEDQNLRNEGKKPMFNTKIFSNDKPGIEKTNGGRAIGGVESDTNNIATYEKTGYKVNAIDADSRPLNIQAGT